MTAKILQFPERKKKMKHKHIDAQLLALLMRNHVLVSQKRKRGFSPKAIAKAILAAEASRRS